MSLDLVEIALDQFTDWATFEKLASEVMRDEGYPDIKPLGGVHDAGQDAVVERFFYSEGKRARIVFQFTLRSDVAAKIQHTIRRLDDRGIQYQQLIIVTKAQISAETQEAIRKQVNRQNELDLEIYERRTLVNRLADLANGMFQRYFPDIRQQVKSLLQPRAGIAQAKEEREKEFLKICYAFSFSPRAQRTRKSLLDETVMGILSVYGREPMSVEQVIQGSRAAFGAEILGDTGQVAAALERLAKRGVVERTGRLFSLTVSERARVEAARISFEATQRSVISDIVAEVCAAAAEPIHDHLRAQLEQNAHELLVEYFRLNGLELVQSFLSRERPVLVYSQGTPRLLDIARRKVPPGLGEILATAIGKALCTPSVEQAHYFAGCSRAYLALEVMNLDPSLREFQVSRFSTKLFVLDTDVVLGAIIEDLPISATYGSLVRGIIALGAKVVVPDEVLAEVATHLQIAPKTYDYFGAGLGGLNEELAVARIGNALVLGYWSRSHRQGWAARADFMRYRENYFDPESARAFIADVVREKLPGVQMGIIGAVLGVTLPEREIETAGSVLMDIVTSTPKGMDRTEEQNRELANQDANLMVAVSKYNQSAGGPANAILGRRGYILTSSGRYVRAGEKLKLDAQVSTRPHLLIGLLEMIEPSPLDDRQFVALFENSLLRQSVEACWAGVKVLLDAGIELKDRAITRLRYDVEKRLHAQISSLRQADSVADDEEDAEPEAGDKEHIALLDGAEKLGYPATRLLAKLREEGKLRETEIARLAAENQELRDAVKRFGKKKERWLRRVERQRGRQ